MLTNNNRWQFLPLGEVASVSPNSFVDGPFGSDLKSDEYTTKGIRLIQLQNIGDGEWIDDNKIFTSEKKYQELKRHAAFPGDIAIAKMADPIARACIIPPVSDRFLVVADCIKLSPDLEKCSPKFIIYAINAHNVRLQAELKSTGTTRKRINLTLLKTVKVDLPPLPEQRRIAEILDTIDEAIQKTEALIAKLKAMKQGLLHDLLTRGLDKNGKFRDPKAHPEQFKDSPLGRIPKEWDVINLGDSFEELYRYPTYYGITYVNYGVPEVRGELIKEDGTMEENATAYRYINKETADRFPRVHIEPGDFVMSVRGTMGKIAIVPKRLRGAVITANLIRMKFVKTMVVSEWARHFLCSPFFQAALDLATSATTIKTIQVPQLCSIPFSRPSVNEQIQIAETLDSHEVRIRTEEQYRDKLKLQKKGLMHDLLTGKVRVKI